MLLFLRSVFVSNLIGSIQVESFREKTAEEPTWTDVREGR